MPTRPQSWSLLLAVILLIVAAPLLADNGEYMPPGKMRDPPPVTPPEGRPVPTGRPLTDTPRPVGVPTPRGGISGRPGTPTPDSLRRSDAIFWEVAWELLRGELIESQAVASPAVRARAEKALGEAVRDESPDVRSEAVLALGRMGLYERAAAAVRGDLTLADRTGLLGPAIAAWQSAAVEREPSLWEVYGPVLEDEESTMFSRALAGIGLSLGGANEASALLGVLEKEKDDPVRRAQYFGLGLTGHPGVRDLLVDRVLPPNGDEPDDAPGRALFLASLSFVSDPEVYTDLVRRLGDKAERVRMAAILSLATEPRARSALFSLAAAGPKGPRSAALLGLGLAGERRVSTTAMKILADPVARGTDLAPVAALVLGMLAEEGEALLGIAADPRADPELRAAAAVGAGLTRERGTGDKFRKVILAADSPRLAAFCHLGRALVDGEKAVAGIERFLAHEKSALARRTAVVALGYAGGERAVELLVKALGDTYFVNRAAAEALYRLAPDRAVDELLVLLGDEKNPFAREYAAYALGRVLALAGRSPLRESLLRAGLGFGTGLERLFLHLESRYLRKILFG